VSEQLSQERAREQQQRDQAEMEQTNSEIEAFRSQVDASGNPVYPYFDHVTGLMGAIISQGGAKTLEEAYKLAVRAHPETSTLVFQAEEAARKAAADEAARKAAEGRRQAALKAQRKGGSIRGSAGTSIPAANGARSIREELQAAFEESRSRL
jgi:sulfite reductase alpha subunit-like flavoprotein